MKPSPGPGHYISVCHDCRTAFPLETRNCPLCGLLLSSDWSVQRKLPKTTIIWAGLLTTGLAAILIIMLLHNTN